MERIIQDHIKRLTGPVDPDLAQQLVETLSAYVDRLMHDGVQIIFFEIPSYEVFQYTDKKRFWRSRLHEAFPPDRYAWVPEVEWNNYRTIDATHLDPDSAQKYSNHLLAWCQQQLVPQHLPQAASASLR